MTHDERGNVLSVKMWRMAWNLTPEFRLRTLRLVPEYPKGDLQRVPFQVDSRLRLSSEGVTDQIVEWLDGLQRLEYLSLDDTELRRRA
ncbi:hypothetical protein [Gemmata obscuriglobus]|uniref:hypothetical protein n=1 Tax=Gemmata obscuriglobus TaxID=114 RepID=UPI0011CDE6D9|nr:hypothetical protein [Gemmata obscuriglobus]